MVLMRSGRGGYGSVAYAVPFLSLCSKCLPGLGAFVEARVSSAVYMLRATAERNEGWCPSASPGP